MNTFFSHFYGFNFSMRIIFTFLFLFSTNLYSQTFESFISGCDHSIQCSKCPPTYKETYQVNVSKQIVIYTGIDLITNKVDSQKLENCSIIDNKNYICGEKQVITRSDGAIVTLDNRTIVRNGLVEDQPHMTITKNGREFNPQTPKKTCRFRKNFFGQYEVVK